MLLPLAALAVLAPLASAGIFHADGTFLVGSPIAAQVLDSCGAHKVTDGIDSNCVDLPITVLGRDYRASFSNAMGDVGIGSVCFYDNVHNLICSGAPTGEIPDSATRVSFSSFLGGKIVWTFDV
jgi:hypothetical protein